MEPIRSIEYIMIENKKYAKVYFLDGSLSIFKNTAFDDIEEQMKKQLDEKENINNKEIK